VLEQQDLLELQDHQDPVDLQVRLALRDSPAHLEVLEELGYPDSQATLDRADLQVLRGHRVQWAHLVRAGWLECPGRQDQPVHLGLLERQEAQVPRAVREDLE